MKNREHGFSMLELLFVMFIMGFVLAAGSEMFISLLRSYKQQSKITETNIEGIIGLELLRRDIESAGYGLPWNIPTGTSYQEASNMTAAAFNDATTNPPRAILSGFDASGRAYLVVKAINLGRNDACTKSTNLLASGATISWSVATENLNPTDRVIIMSPGGVSSTIKTLTGPTGANLGTLLQFSDVPTLKDPNQTQIVYGVAPADGSNKLRMPFNRADYYVSTTVSIPGRCAQGTGVLVKAIVSQSDGGFDGVNMLPLLDCVADMQVVTYLDTDANGSWDIRSNGLSLTSAQLIRDQLEEVHVYVLAHEGQRDTSYTHNSQIMLIGETTSLGRNIDLSTIGDPNWRNYRWKIYTMVVRPNNLR